MAIDFRVNRFVIIDNSSSMKASFQKYGDVPEDLVRLDFYLFEIVNIISPCLFIVFPIFLCRKICLLNFWRLEIYP